MAEPPAGPGGYVVAVLGYSGRSGEDLHPICADRLTHAERLAEGARAVVLSGWARRTRARPECELMRLSWSGPDVPLVCDADARTTADNAANVAAAAAALGADELVVVTSWWHKPRTRVLLRAALRGRPIRVSVAAAGGRRAPLPLLVREAACLALLPYFVRATLARTRN